MVSGRSAREGFVNIHGTARASAMLDSCGGQTASPQLNCKSQEERAVADRTSQLTRGAITIYGKCLTADSVFDCRRILKRRRRHCLPPRLATLERHGWAGTPWPTPSLDTGFVRGCDFVMTGCSMIEDVSVGSVPQAHSWTAVEGSP